MSARAQRVRDEDVWRAVAGPTTDPVRLADVVALRTTAAGRSALRAGQGVLDVAGRLGDRRAAVDAARRWSGLGVRVVLPGDDGWPTRLDRLAEPPFLLAVRGAPPDPARPAVAIVGARRATPYGTGVAAWLAEAAAEAGATVVSGGARGIDAAAHDAALSRGTAVVLGCGHDVPYPRPHARVGGLFDDVLAGGGALLSELLPGTSPHPGAVRARNRIVAALADLVVVVEGGDRSGSLLTAGAAADLGVDVLAVPGDVRAPGSVAPHRLLREGAGPCTSPEDLLAALATGLRSPDRTGGGTTTLPAPLHRVLTERWPRPLRTEELTRASGLGVGTVLAAVTRGVVAGELADGPDGLRLRRAPPAP